MTFGYKTAGSFQSVEGAVFKYNDGTKDIKLTDNGNGVEIPMEYLGTLTVTPPQDYSDYTATSVSGDSTAKTTIKVQAKTVDVDEDASSTQTDTAISGESYLTLVVKGVADPATLAVDPAEGFEDQAIIGGNNRDGSIPATIDPALGIPLDIRPSSRDNDGSETYDVTISDIPAGVQLYQDNNGTVTLLDTSSGSVTIADYTKIVDNLYFVPAENFSGTVNLKVQAVSKEDGTTGTPSPMLNLPVKVIGKADLITNDDLATDTHNYITDEAALDSTGNHQIALSSVFSTVMEIEAYDGDSPAAEQVVYRVENLPASFNLTGAGVTFLGGSGTDRVWSVTLEALQNNTAQLKTPDNFAGEINFTITGATTETISGDSVTHGTQNVSVLITPDAADSVDVNPQVLATEDVWATINFVAAFTTKDQGTLTTGQESLKSVIVKGQDLIRDGLMLKVTEADGKITVYGDRTNTDYANENIGLVEEQLENKDYVFDATDKVEVMYGIEHLDTSVTIPFDYTYTDTTTLPDGSTVTTTSAVITGNQVDVTFQAVTDQPTLTLTPIILIGDTAPNNTIDNGGSVVA